ncbi:ABC transporter ATP-binding protein [[Clostridium] polysaccharolyticum]|uniref:ABC-type multidrug transport system, ATPase component n=1 Tax=[Clostridium] polysaccharolyticum TaxID=29364 RepID=A0A1I0DE10_9FIRM|nr:ABC transporter ATP-binding protein [[Clostridium] polysaccharolyticum]SET30573.1 ABC-type multidrug transport system, ATPase component [[Clostridium] polysaccharolyticum]
MELKISNITKRYGKTVALNKVSMTLCNGIYGLLGPNGAGKTTLMNILVNDMEPDEGQIIFNGQEINKLGKAYRKCIGYMPQQQCMYEYFTGYRFLSYMAALKGMDAKTAAERIQSIAKKVNLDQYLENKIGSYSGGMKQRLLIAQAVLDEPAVLVLDEPTAGLDPKERIRIRNLISEIAKDKIVIIATHVVQDIEYIAKEIILLKKGDLICKSTPKGIISRLQDKVFEISCKEEEVGMLSKKYLVTNIVREENFIKVRAICEEVPAGFLHNMVTASIEDCYLYEFQDEIG